MYKYFSRIKCRLFLVLSTVKVYGLQYILSYFSLGWVQALYIAVNTMNWDEIMHVSEKLTNS